MPLDPYLDHVSGVIIGGDETPVRAAIFYDKRPQGGNIHAASDADAMTQAKALKQAFIREAGPSCYTDDSLWELRIFTV